MGKIINATPSFGGAPKLLRCLEVGDAAIFNLDEFKVTYIRSLACNIGLEMNYKLKTNTRRSERVVEVSRLA